MSNKPQATLPARPDMSSGWPVEYTVRPSFEREYALRVTSPRDGADATLEVQVATALQVLPWHEAPPDSVRRTSIAAAEARSLFSMLSTARLPAAPPFAFGFDGRTYELRIVDGAHNVTYQWWCDLPEPWRELRAAVDLLEACARRHVGPGGGQDAVASPGGAEGAEGGAQALPTGRHGFLDPMTDPRRSRASDLLVALPAGALAAAVVLALGVSAGHLAWPGTSTALWGDLLGFAALTSGRSLVMLLASVLLGLPTYLVLRRAGQLRLRGFLACGAVPGLALGLFDASPGPVVEWLDTSPWGALATTTGRPLCSMCRSSPAG